MRLSSARSVDFGEIFVNPTNQLSKNQGATWFESVKRKHNEEREVKFGARASLKDFGDIVKNNDSVRMKLEKEAAKLMSGLPLPAQASSLEEVKAVKGDEPAAEEEEEDMYANMDDGSEDEAQPGQVRADPTEQFKEYMSRSSTTATSAKRKNTGKGGGKKKKAKAGEEEDEDQEDAVSASTGTAGMKVTNVEWMRLDPEMAQVGAKYTSKTRKEAPVSLMKLQLLNFVSGKSEGNQGNQHVTGVP